MPVTPGSVSEALADLAAGNHLCWLYETEEEHRALLAPYLRQGLERGEKVLYIADIHAPETILGYLRDDGLEVERYLASGRLGILTANDIYMRDGVFDPDKTITLLRSETERALNEGYTALRVTGEMTWALRGLPGAERLIEYESKLNTFFPGSKCLGICQYDRRRFLPDVLLDVLSTHPTVVVGTLLYDNFYYTPTVESPRRDLPALTLRYWLEGLATRKRAERDLRRLSRGVKILSACNLVMIDATGEGELLQKVCQILVDVGRYRLAWVGLAQRDEAKTVRPVAHAGTDEGYLESLNGTWADSEGGRGPTGTAIRTGQPCVARNTSTDAAFLPWRTEAIKRGYAATIALPLVTETNPFGALNVCAAEADAFEADEVKMLAQLAKDLAYGVGALRTRAERTRTAEEIHRLNEELEARVKERTAELQAMNAELEAFTYSVSHDLRAPLRHVDGFSKLLLENFSAELPEKAKHYLSRVREGTQRMGQMVDDLLALTRLGRTPLKVQMTGLDTLVEEVRRELQPEVAGREIEWRIGPLPFVECDPALLKQVLANLLSNAVKFTRPRPSAVVEVGATMEDGAPVIFVRDNGVGFSMKYADKLFVAFQRLHRREDFEGEGVGLATVQRIIHRHGGRVWAEGQLNRGATFYFSLGAGEGRGMNNTG